MSFFRMFGPKSDHKPEIDPVKQAMGSLAQVLFPGGYDQVKLLGQQIASLLDNRITQESASAICAGARYLLHSGNSNNEEQVVSYIVKKGSGIISESQARIILCDYIRMPQPARTAASEPIFLDSSLQGKIYVLRNDQHAVRVSALLFTSILLALRAKGWKGADILFSSEGASTFLNSLYGSYKISCEDAADIHNFLKLAVGNLDEKTASAFYPMISISSEGEFVLDVD